MKQYNKVIGFKGEKEATSYLKKNKYKILETNYRNTLGEIDIIAKQKETVIFVEVKSRETCAFGRPSESVDYIKQNKIHNVALVYLKNNKLLNSKCRFDIIELIGQELNHIENAF